MFGDCFTVFVTNLDGNLDLFDHLKWNRFGEVIWNLDRFYVLEGFGDGNVFHNGDLDGDFDGVGFRDELYLGCDRWVFGVDMRVGREDFAMSN